MTAKFKRVDRTVLISIALMTHSENKNSEIPGVIYSHQVDESLSFSLFQVESSCASPKREDAPADTASKD
jgi:hypothetical protein